MKKKTKIWSIAAICLIIIGLIIFVLAMSENGWDFTKLSTENYTTNTYELNDDFENISFDTDTVDIVFKSSDTNQTKVVCFENKNLNHSVKIEENTLKIGVIDERKWYEHIGINFHTPNITIYLPKREYSVLSIKESTGDIELPKDFHFESIDISVSTGDVKILSSATDFIKIKSSTGDIFAENISANMLDLSVSTGEIVLQNVSCSNFVSSGDTGDLALQNVIAKENFSIERSTGNIKLDGCDAKELLIKTDTGDVKGTLLSDKVFIVESDTGSIDVPKSVTGGKCEIVTDTGDIKIDIK